MNLLAQVVELMVGVVEWLGSGWITIDSIYEYVGWGSVLMVMEVGLMAAVVKLMV